MFDSIPWIWYFKMLAYYVEDTIIGLQQAEKGTAPVFNHLQLTDITDRENLLKVLSKWKKIVSYPKKISHFLYWIINNPFHKNGLKLNEN